MPQHRPDRGRLAVAEARQRRTLHQQLHALPLRGKREQQREQAKQLNALRIHLIRPASSESSSSTSNRQSALRAPHQVEPRGGDQPGPLGRRDALGGAAEALVAPVAHLGEHQRAALLGHEVDFAVPAAPVARQHPQARPAQQFRAQFLGSHAGPVHGSLNDPPPHKVDPQT